jgi:hypothetical protein
MDRLATSASLCIILFTLTAGCSTATDGDQASGASAPAGDNPPAPGGDPKPDAGGDIGKECTKPADCASKICSAAGTCQAPTCDDNTQNQAETDTDCGGTCKKCEDTKKCAVAGDCTSGVCAGTCQAPTNSDGVKNGSETDVDCGGTGNPKCTDGKTCGGRDDCASDVCDAGKCKTPVCDDGAKNGTETDVDCGGPACPRCGDNKGCLAAGDCTSGVCKGGKCQPPSPTDGVKNGTETDIDCGGGGGNPQCGVGLGCLAHSDCTTDGCGYDNKCAGGRSCTQHNGGDTCGSGGAGGIGAAAWESCCTTASVAGVKVGKYQVTAGRMRAFMDRTKGDVRTFIQNARAAGQLHGATMNASWDLYLPTSMEGCDQLGNCGAGELTDHFYNDNGSFQGIYTSAYRHLGGAIFDGQSLGQQGCRIDAPGTHSYWMSDKVQSDYFGDKPTEQPQSVYDTKPLNCVNYLMAQAFCIWDGGRLETQAEYKAVGGPVDSGGAANGAVPWGTPKPFAVGSSSYYGCRFPTATDAMLRGLPAGNACTGHIPPAGFSIEEADYAYSYEYPNLGTWDFIVFLSAPGRFNRRVNGIADLVGPIMEMTSDVNGVTASPKTTLARWAANGSWEGHQWGYYGWNFTLLNKYGKQGLRCVY